MSNLIVYLYDSPRDGDGVHTGPKDHFNIDMNLPNFDGGELRIPAGTYSIGEPEVYAPQTLEPGFADEFEIGGVLYGEYYGVFHQVIDAEQNESYEMADEGEMTVGYENGIYTIDFEFYDDNENEDHIVSGSFSGKMEYIYDAATPQAKTKRMPSAHRGAEKRSLRMRR